MLALCYLTEAEILGGGKGGKEKGWGCNPPPSPQIYNLRVCINRLNNDEFEDVLDPIVFCCRDKRSRVPCKEVIVTYSSMYRG